MIGFFQRISVIAEVAQTYEGSFDLAWATVDAAARAQADVINFQVFAADELVVPSHHHHDLFRRIELPIAQWRRLFEHARELGLEVMVNVFGTGTAERVADAVSAFKIHASDVSHVPFLRCLAGLGKPLLLSAGGSTLGELSRAISILRERSEVELGLILGVQNTPTALEDTNLARIGLIKERFGLPVGYADHVDADLPMAKIVPLLAVAAGAEFVEKHLNLARSIKREDYVASLNPDEFAEMTTRFKEARQCVGLPGGSLGEGERGYREAMKRRVVARQDVEAGQVLSYDHLALLRTDAPGGLWNLDSAVGRTVSRPLQTHDVVRAGDLSEKPAALKRVAAVLLCRANSTRLYAKPLQRVGEKAILEHLIDQLRLIARINQIVLAISEGPENAGFVTLARRLGFEYVVGDEEDGLSRMIKAAEFIEAETIFRVTTENPFLYLDNATGLLETHLAEGADLTVCEALPDGTYPEIIELSALKRSHEVGERKHRSAWVSLYIYEHLDEFKVVRTLPPEPLRRPEIRLTVDYPEDLIVMRKIYEAFEGRMPIPIASIIAFLDTHPEIKAINGGIEAGVGRIWR